MASLIIVKQLEQVPLFSKVKRPQLRELADLVKIEEHGPGLFVCQQGQPGDRFFVVQQGKLRISRVDTEGRVLEVHRLESGDSFGETSLLLGDVHDATIETVQHSTLLVIERAGFDKFLEENPRVESALQMRPDVAERRQYPNFSWLEEGELPVRVMHKHPIVLITPLLLPIILNLILLLASIVVRQQWSDPWGGIAMTVGLALMLIPTLAGLYFYIDWRNDVYAVTNHRVIHMERVGLFSEQFAAAPLHAIEDVQQIYTGPVSRFLDYGDLVVETAGELGQVVFRNIPHLSKVQEVIFRQAERTHAQSRADERTAIRRALRHHFVEGEAEADSLLEEAEEPKPEPKKRRLRDRIRALNLHLLPPAWHEAGDTITWRKHWSALVKAIGVPSLTFGATTAFILIISSNRPELTLDLIFPYAVGVLIIVPWLLWQFENWQNDFYQITPTRLIHVERLPFYLREERREASLERITSVRFEQSVLGRILQYGTVVVETHAEAGGFNLKSVMYPQKVQSEIFSRMEKFRKRRQEQEAQRHQKELLDWFSVYDEIRRTKPEHPNQEESD